MDYIGSFFDAMLLTLWAGELMSLDFGQCPLGGLV